MDLAALRAVMEANGADVGVGDLGRPGSRSASSSGIATTGRTASRRSACGSRRRCTTGPTTGARSARRSRRSASSRRRSTSGTTPASRAACPRPSPRRPRRAEAARRQSTGGWPVRRARRSGPPGASWLPSHAQSSRAGILPPLPIDLDEPVRDRRHVVRLAVRVDVAARSDAGQLRAVVARHVARPQRPSWRGTFPGCDRILMPCAFSRALYADSSALL